MNPVSVADLDHVLAKTPGIWDEFRGREIFITGGTGFFGQWLLETFVHANEKLGLGARAMVLTRSAESFRTRSPRLGGHPAIRFHEGDVRTFTFPKGSFSHVIHAATAASEKLNQENPAEMRDVIVDGTERALEFAHAAGAKKFLFTSSGAVYGRQPSALTHISEDHASPPEALNAGNAYAEGKRLAEALCLGKTAQRGIALTIARCFAFVGPHLPFDQHYAIGNFLRDGLAGTPIQIAGDGTPRRSYLYAADLAAWLWTILVRGAAGRAYNVGSDADVSIRDVAAEVSWELHVPVKIAGKPTPGQAVQRYVPSVARARAELGLDVWIDLPDAIRRTMQWAQGTGR